MPSASLLRKMARRLSDGISISRKPAAPPPIEFSPREVEIYKYVIRHKLTMVSSARLIATMVATKHVVQHGIPGAFVECGVWRGGNAIAAKLILDEYSDERQVYLFDTFAGMTAPNAIDVKTKTGKSAVERYNFSKREGYVDWCYSSLAEVKGNFVASGIALDSVRFVAGDVHETLRDESNIPEQIALLRLDTDWYSSTMVELEVMYPRVSVGGVILYDDFGNWDGARLAVTEYFARPEFPVPPTLFYTDKTGRMSFKSAG